jgi:hypothetical protein
MQPHLFKVLGRSCAGGPARVEYLLIRNKIKSGKLKDLDDVQKLS